MPEQSKLEALRDQDEFAPKGYGAWQIGSHFNSPPYIVKGVLDEGETTTIFGASQTLKSFVALDMLLHVAAGMEWRGFKVKKTAVLVVLGEGAGSYPKRIYAWLKSHSLFGMPKDVAPWLWVNPEPVDLHNAPEMIADLINEASEAIGEPVKLVLIDTLSTNLGEGADENSTGHMATIIARSQQAVRKATDGKGSLVFVHHSGHGAGDRERGSSTLAGNLDNRILVYRDGDNGLGENITIQCRKRKDGELFDPFCLTYRVVNIGKDEDGDPITSLVLAKSDAEPIAVTGKPKAKRKKTMQNLFDEALGIARQLNGGSVDQESVRTQFYILHDGDSDAKRKAFSRGWKGWSESAVKAANQAAEDGRRGR